MKKNIKRGNKKLKLFCMHFVLNIIFQLWGMKQRVSLENNLLLFGGKRSQGAQKVKLLL